MLVTKLLSACDHPTLPGLTSAEDVKELDARTPSRALSPRANADDSDSDELVGLMQRMEVVGHCKNCHTECVSVIPIICYLQRIGFLQLIMIIVEPVMWHIRGSDRRRTIRAIDQLKSERCSSSFVVLKSSTTQGKPLFSPSLLRCSTLSLEF